MKKIYLWGLSGNAFFEMTIWMLYLQHFGWSLAEIALLQAVLNLAQFVFEIPSGMIADRIGRKFSLLLGEGFIILYALSFLMPNEHWLVFAGFLSYGLGSSLISGSDQALLYDQFSNEDNTYMKLFSRYNGIALLAFATSGLLGSFVIGFSWQLPFILTIVSQIVTLLILIQFPSEKGASDGEKQTFAQFIKEIMTFFKSDKQYRRLVYMIAIPQATFSMLHLYGAVLLNEFEFSIDIIGVIMFALTMVGSGLSFQLNKIYQKFQLLSVVKWLFVIGTAFALAYASSMAWLILVAFAYFAVIYDVWDVGLNNLLHDSVTSNMRATMVSVVNFIVAVLMAAESAILGLLDNYLSLNTIFAILSTLAIGATLLLLFNYRQLSNKI